MSTKNYDVLYAFRCSFCTLNPKKYKVFIVLNIKFNIFAYFRKYRFM